MDYEQRLRQLLTGTEIYRPADEVFALVNDDPLTGERLVLCGYNTNETDPIAGFDIQLVVPRYCYILHMTVRPDHRRQGIASKLVRCLEIFALENNIHKLIVTPAGDGHMFWPKVGFTPNPESSLSLIKMIDDNSQYEC